MRPQWMHHKEFELTAYRTAIAFLRGRLQDQATIDWALSLKPRDAVKRLALLELLDGPEGRNLPEPWRTAWRFIEESWADPVIVDPVSTGVHQAQRRLRTGDRSGSLITAILGLVAPRLEIKSFDMTLLRLRKLPKRPKRVEDLFWLSLTSGITVDPSALELAILADRPFLVSLALALDASVTKGLDIARRLGWDGTHRMGLLGQLHRVYYIPGAARDQNEHEPDEFYRGIAPSVKLLYAVIERLIDIDISTAVDYVNRYRIIDTPVHLRLWAALSRDARVTPAAEVSSKLLTLDDHGFWDLRTYPEIAELRAKRFAEFAPKEQAKITARLRRRPPLRLWSRKEDTVAVKNARLYWAVRELRRIELTGATLPLPDQAWLAVNIQKFPDLMQMHRVDEGFLITFKDQKGQPYPDDQYNLLTGEERLKALETALSSERSRWEDNSATHAWDWLRQPEKQLQVLQDLESIPDGGAAFVKVWELFGWNHSPVPEPGDAPGNRDLPQESARVLSLLAKLPETTIHQAIDGISEWLFAWRKQILLFPEGFSVWLKLWPVAVEVTNAQQPAEEEINLNTVVQSSDDSQDLDTLRTPAGKFVGVFLAACPNLQINAHPFDVDGPLRWMREATIASTDRSGLIARRRMIEHLPYFFNAAPDWTEQYLINPLLTDISKALPLWRGIARNRQSFEVLEIIGIPMTERAIDLHLDRETRRSLVFSLIVDCLHALNQKSTPAVEFPRIQQMLRSLDDEVRTSAAEVVPRFVRENSAPRGDDQVSSPEDLFRAAAKPFLQQVWPQERSLATPGISRALADLPATAGDAFAEAVDTIERFLVPFECWSIFAYGLYTEKEDNIKLSLIDNPEKAEAFLKLLNLTIGTSEGAVIPDELADALDQVRRVAPNLAGTRAFRRLATAARR